MKRIIYFGLFTTLAFFAVLTVKNLVSTSYAGFINESQGQYQYAEPFDICGGEAVVVDEEGNMPYSQTLGYITASHGSPGNEIKISTSGKFTGFAYSQTAGWISMEGVHMDGVQIDCATGELSGNAYGQLIGYLSFDTDEGEPKVSEDGKFTGFAYSQTAGWVSLAGWVVELPDSIEVNLWGAENCSDINCSDWKDDELSTTEAQLNGADFKAVLEADSYDPTKDLTYSFKCSATSAPIERVQASGAPNFGTYVLTNACDYLADSTASVTVSQEDVEGSDTLFIGIGDASVPTMCKYCVSDGVCSDDTCMYDSSGTSTCPADGSGGNCTISNENRQVIFCSSDDDCAGYNTSGSGSMWQEVAP